MYAITRYLPIGLIGFLLTICAVVSCSEHESGQEVAQDEKTEKIYPDQVMYDSDIIFSEHGMKKALIRSSYLEEYEDADSAVLADIDATFYDSLGHVTSTLDADSGLARKGAEWLYVWGNVKVKSEDGVLLEADSLRWDQNKNLMETESFVRITHEGNVQSGYGLESDNTLTNFRILRGVKGKFDNIEEP